MEKTRVQKKNQYEDSKVFCWTQKTLIIIRNITKKQGLPSETKDLKNKLHSKFIATSEAILTNMRHMLRILLCIYVYDYKCVYMIHVCTCLKHYAYEVTVK